MLQIEPVSILNAGDDLVFEITGGVERVGSREEHVHRIFPKLGSQISHYSFSIHA